MGQSTWGQSGYSLRAVNMKMLVVLALVACVVAEPEAEASADPYYLGGYRGYGGYGGYGLGYSRLGYSRLGYGGLYRGYRYGYGKREAEAEPEADAEASADPYYLGGYRGYGGYGLGYSTLGYSRLGYSRFGYGGLYGRYGGYGYGKREAEAEPEADAEASADPYYLGGYGGYRG